jgi:anti-anti-sigma factor
MPVLEGHTTAVDVLIAEDDAPTREGIRRLLEQQGYRCAEAGDGREALELARRHLPRCVLLDLRMPALDGLAVACQLRADPRTCGAAIHCLTGLTDEGSRREARAAGCEAYLTKPVDPAALLEVLRPRTGDTGEWAHGLTKAEAEGLLDWLEAQGATGELAVEGVGFAVRCPGFQVGREVGGRVTVRRPRTRAVEGGKGAASAMPAVSLESEQVGDVTVVRIACKRLLDEPEMGRVRRNLLRLAEEPGRRRMVLDFRQVEALSGAVLAGLLALRQALLTQGGRLALCGLRPDVRELFVITGLERSLNVYLTEQEALLSF